MVRRIVIGVVIAFLLSVFFSYRILDVPTGLTYDEASFGYNAVLIANTGHDENERFFPLFVQSSNKMDWRQPVTQYYLALLFKVFGPSVFLLRFSSVIIAIVSIFLIYFLGRQMIGRAGALA